MEMSEQKNITAKRKRKIDCENIPVIKNVTTELGTKKIKLANPEEQDMFIEYLSFFHEIQHIVLSGLPLPGGFENLLLEKTINKLWIIRTFLKNESKLKEGNENAPLSLFLQKNMEVGENEMKNGIIVVQDVQSVLESIQVSSLENIEEDNIKINKNPLPVSEANGKNENKVIFNSIEDNLKLSKNSARKVKNIEFVIEEIWDLNKNHLFVNLKKEEHFCKICTKPNKLLECAGECHSWIHKECATTNNNNNGDKYIADTFLCQDCPQPKCFVCKNNNDCNLMKCSIVSCGKYFHIKCVEYLPQFRHIESSLKKERLNCPSHVCHTCTSGNPSGSCFSIEKRALVKCIQCPVTYHLDSFCIPAGTQFLTETEIICPRHMKVNRNKKKVNVNWCFNCKYGGKLICCELCPVALHEECLNLENKLMSDKYICLHCDSGLLPLYGDLVFAKFGSCRWWPSIILPPSIVPKKLITMKHNPYDFCVRFLGTDDYAWINFSCVYLYKEGDRGKINVTKKADEHYNFGLEEASKVSKIINMKKIERKNKEKYEILKPLPYVPIKHNVIFSSYKPPDNNEVTECKCDSNMENPCGPKSNCMNRTLKIECDPKMCRAGSECQNQRFNNAIYPKLEVIHMNAKGWGLMTKEPLTARSFVIEYVGEIINETEFNTRMNRKFSNKHHHCYLAELEMGYRIDAEYKGNLSRFINHSCEPNCKLEKWTVKGETRIAIFTIEDIPANTEITFDYNYSDEDDKQKCFCGSDKCSGFIGEKYKKNIKRGNSNLEKIVTTKGANKNNGSNARSG